MTLRVDISPQMISWARERAALEPSSLLKRFPKLLEWESGVVHPTLNQLESFAKAVAVPFGFLFLREAPQEPLPIPDFRTFDNKDVLRPSPNLLDMIYACQERQSWYRDFAQTNGLPKLPFIGSVQLSETPETVAGIIAKQIGFDMTSRMACRTLEEARRFLIQKADQSGILVMVSGVVFSNNRRKLDLDEFRGFALSDRVAPLIFINGADSKSGQMFTLAHELAHLWLNSTGISNIGPAPSSSSKKEEIWCNAVAAELLVPHSTLRSLLHDRNEKEIDLLLRLSKYFKVSKLVVLRRLLDVGWLDHAAFNMAWAREKALFEKNKNKTTKEGGDFYRTTALRVGRRFTLALVSNTLEGQTLYRDAFRMLGVSKTETLYNLGREVGMVL
jgi:Zn-dependent peptidase ImmA (M78 family)